MPSGQEPPTYPTDLDDLQEAYTLCGHYSRTGRNSGKWGSNRRRLEDRLVQLVGRLPASRNEAARWKIWLRQLWRDAMKEEPIKIDDAQNERPSKPLTTTKGT